METVSRKSILGRFVRFGLVGLVAASAIGLTALLGAGASNVSAATSSASGPGMPASIHGCFTAALGPGVMTSRGTGGRGFYAFQPVYLEWWNGSTGVWFKDTSGAFLSWKTDAYGCLLLPGVTPGYYYRMRAYFDATSSNCGIYQAFSQWGLARAGLTVELGTFDTTPAGTFPSYCQSKSFG